MLCDRLGKYGIIQYTGCLLRYVSYFKSRDIILKIWQSSKIYENGDIESKCIFYLSLTSVIQNNYFANFEKKNNDGFISCLIGGNFKNLYFCFNKF